MTPCPCNLSHEDIFGAVEPETTRLVIRVTLLVHAESSIDIAYAQENAKLRTNHVLYGYPSTDDDGQTVFYI